jgi:hypothetical protein
MVFCHARSWSPQKKIAHLFRMLGTTGGERKNAFAALERILQNNRIDWNDIGDVIANGAEQDDGKYTEAEMQEFAQAARAEGVEAGIKMGKARASNGNGCLTLPEPFEMAEYCHDRLRRLKDSKQREFVSDVYLITQRGTNLSLGRLGYLASIYIQIGGRI